jgi:hypothetical protein
MTQWPNDTSYCYNLTMEHLKDYFNKFSTLKHAPNQIIFDFGWFYNIEKILAFTSQIEIAVDIKSIEEYQNYQMPLLLDLPTSNSMEDIVSLISDNYFVSSPWYACYCIFCYERINLLKESQRLWTIDQLPMMTKESLIELSLQYD